MRNIVILGALSAGALYMFTRKPVPGTVDGRAPLSVPLMKPQTTGNPASAQSVPNNKGNQANQPWSGSTPNANGTVATIGAVTSIVSNLWDMFGTSPEDFEGPDYDEEEIDDFSYFGSDSSSNDDSDYYEFDSSFGEDYAEWDDDDTSYYEDDGDYWEDEA